MCEIVAGYTLPNCRSVGGIKKFIIYNLENRASYVRTANAITAISMDVGKQAYQFNVEMELSNAISTGTGTRADFTFFYAQAVQIVLADKTQTNIDLLELFNKGRLGVIAFYNNDLVRHFGLVNGLMVDTDTDDSGTEFGNRNGDTLVLSGKETQKAPTITAAKAENLLNVAS